MGNEVDFMVHGYVPLNIFGHEVWLTTTHVCLLIVCLFMLVIGLIVNNKMKHATEVPGMVQNIAELYVEMMDGVVQSSMFRHWGKYANYILTIFMFLLFSNISGLFGLRSDGSNPIIPANQYYQRICNAGFTVAASVW